MHFDGNLRVYAHSEVGVETFDALCILTKKYILICRLVLWFFFFMCCCSVCFTQRSTLMQHLQCFAHPAELLEVNIKY